MRIKGEIVTYGEAAEMLGVTERYIRKYVEQGRLVPVRRGIGWLYKADVQRVLTDGLPPTSASYKAYTRAATAASRARKAAAKRAEGKNL